MRDPRKALQPDSEPTPADLRIRSQISGQIPGQIPGQIQGQIAVAGRGGADLASRLRAWPVALSALLLIPAAGLAQDGGDPPATVGRIAYVEGTVSYRPTAQDPWAVAAVNVPLTAGASLWTEPGARASIEIAGARVRLDGGTEVDVLALDPQNIEVGVPLGRADIHIAGIDGQQSYSVAAPRGTSGLVAAGDYRAVAGDQDNPTRLAVFNGEAQFAGPDATTEVDPGGEAVAAGDPPQVQLVAASEDDFDRWCDEREARLAARVASRYVSPATPGYAELDDYGQWRDVPNYGAVWIPTNVDPGWQPYREGHWQYVTPWGWTWIDNQPWGFAPFHYGRWANIDGSWAWVPGEVEAQPVYAPALVAWVGDPGAIALGLAGGAAIGWFALGPGEVYRPWYHSSPDYLRQVNVANVSRTTITNITNTTTINNITNVTNVNNTTTNYANARYATVVPRQAFVSAKPVAQAALRVAPNAPIRVASGPAQIAQILPRATPASRLGSAMHAAAPVPATFGAARAMQVAQKPAVPVAGRFVKGGALVHATPAAAANFHPPQPNAARPAPAVFRGSAPAGAARTVPHTPVPTVPASPRPQAPAAPLHASPAAPPARPPAPPAARPAERPAVPPARPEAARPEAARPEAARPSPHPAVVAPHAPAPVPVPAPRPVPAPHPVAPPAPVALRPVAPATPPRPAAAPAPPHPVPAAAPPRPAAAHPVRPGEPEQGQR